MCCNGGRQTARTYRKPGDNIQLYHKNEKVQRKSFCTDMVPVAVMTLFPIASNNVSAL